MNSDLPTSYQLNCQGLAIPTTCESIVCKPEIPSSFMSLIDSDLTPQSVESVSSFLFNAIHAGHKRALINIMTNGGNANYAAGIYDSIIFAQSFGLEVICVAMGTIQSAGVMILQSANTRLMMQHCSMFLHPTNISNLTPKAEKRDLDFARMIDARYASILASRSRLSVDEIQNIRGRNNNQGAYIDAPEALKYGLVDGIVG